MKERTMVVLFRGLILLAPVLSVLGSLVPFPQAMNLNLQLQGIVPVLVLLATLFGLLGGVSWIVATVGLLAFRRWARVLAIWCAVAWALSTALTLGAIPMLRAMAPAAIALYVAGALCWIGALVLARTQPLSARFT
ncbi:hypothetical protein [Luteimonas aquatica]|uniref:hypothetical protein n=1 Tax=Luteimonas aquatica TaxID=450364 RepID=UPI001F5943DD|nr:hypothetical protein [Luteimonas aquatica]